MAVTSVICDIYIENDVFKGQIKIFGNMGYNKIASNGAEEPRALKHTESARLKAGQEQSGTSGAKAGGSKMQREKLSL